MFIDITWFLMGDPGSTHRRPPTSEEIRRLDQREAYCRRNAKRHPPGDRRLLTLMPGEELTGLTEGQAKAGCAWLARNGKQGSMKRILGDGYRLRRVA